jgi:hypothetical protein
VRLALLNQPLATALFGDCHKLIFVLFLAVVAQLQEVFSFFQFQFLFKVQRIKYTTSNSLQEMPKIMIANSDKSHLALILTFLEKLEVWSLLNTLGIFHVLSIDTLFGFLGSIK